MHKEVCFFSNEPLEAIEQEQYSLQDINILKDLGYTVVIANNFGKVPFGCDLYFSWWASGSFIPLIKAKISGKPIIVIAGGNESMLYRDSIDEFPAGYLSTQWYKKIATKLTLRLASKICVVSNFMLEDTKKLGATNPIVLHNSVDTNRFKISDFNREYVTIIFKLDENVTKLKRGEIFIRSIPEILKKFPIQKFLIIGKKANYYSKLKELCNLLGISNSIEFIGSVKNIEIIEWLQKSKVYVQISDTETFGVAIAEAMSCGTHVVVSKRGAIPEVVGQDGVYVDHNDPISTANGIIKILQMEDSTYNLISHKLRQRIIDNFSYSLRKAKLEEIIKELL
jgi:glycosyltransferase involved in cell wall biosynthesis